MTTRFRSLQAQLLLRLAAAFVVATILAVSALVYEGTQAAQSLGDDELERRAVQIAQFVVRGPDGALHLTLPERLDRLYQSPARTRLLAVRSADGAIVAASAPEFAAEVGRWPPADGHRRPFQLDDFGPTSQDYNGLTVRVDSVAGPRSTRKRTGEKIPAGSRLGGSLVCGSHAGHRRLEHPSQLAAGARGL